MRTKSPKTRVSKKKARTNPAYAALFALGVFLLVILAAAWFFRGQPAPSAGDLSCVSQKEERVVRGDSLAGVVEDGDTITILFDYYDCNEIALGDMVAYFYAGSEEPLVKMIKAVPGDTFELRPDGSVWRIVVNGRMLRNSAGEPYAVTPERYRRFYLYQRDYGRGLPANTYMLLSNTASDSVDSRAFGLVDKSDILGKVVY